MKNIFYRAYRFVAEFFVTFSYQEHRLAFGVILLAALYVLANLTVVYIADVLQVTEAGSERGMWWHLFRNRGPVEWGQWTFLSLISLSAAAFAGIFHDRGDNEKKIFWALVAVSFILMLIEDAGDPRHFLADYGARLFGIKRMYTEGAFFAFILSPLVVAILGYWKVVVGLPPQSRLYFLMGGLFYGTAASTSLFREEGGFYVNLGERLSAAIARGNIPGFFLMDFVLEECLELMAVAIIFAGIVMYWKAGLKKATTT